MSWRSLKFQKLYGFIGLSEYAVLVLPAHLGGIVKVISFNDSAVIQVLGIRRSFCVGRGKTARALVQVSYFHPSIPMRAGVHIPSHSLFS